MAASICVIEGCESLVHIKKRGLCRFHYQRGWSSGAFKENRPYDAIKDYECRTCDHCGGVFLNRRSKRFCSKACENRFYRCENASKTCGEIGCDKPLVAKGLCAMHWRRKARAEGREKAPVWDESRKANWKKREALKRGANGAESFSYPDVYERDSWVCGLCGESIDRSLSWPDPLSVSLDHIVPLSKGGAHTMANVQAAHLVCNVSKGNREEEVRR